MVFPREILNLTNTLYQPAELQDQPPPHGKLPLNGDLKQKIYFSCTPYIDEDGEKKTYLSVFVKRESNDQQTCNLPVDIEEWLPVRGKVFKRSVSRIVDPFATDLPKSGKGGGNNVPAILSTLSNNGKFSPPSDALPASTQAKLLQAPTGAANMKEKVDLLRSAVPSAEWPDDYPIVMDLGQTLSLIHI